MEGSERFVAEMVFTAREGMPPSTRKYMMDSGSTFNLIDYRYLRE